jgi:hypothetical protein
LQRYYALNRYATVKRYGLNWMRSFLFQYLGLSMSEVLLETMCNKIFIRK